MVDSIFRRALTSRIAVIANIPSSVSSGERLISAGNSVPSFRSPNSSRPPTPPMGRVRGSRK